MHKPYYEIVAYRVHFYGRSQHSVDRDQRAAIFLIGKDEPPTGPVVGRIYFYAPEVADRKQDRRDEEGRLEGHLSSTELDAVLDMLRFEKPIKLYWDDTTDRLSLETGLEPAGEHDV